mgnify:CR=1 FL=1
MRGTGPLRCGHLGGLFLRTQQLCEDLTQDPEIVPTRNRLVLIRRGKGVLGRSEWFQEVPSKVLGEMLGESLSQVESSSHVVSSSPIWTSTERTPSPF